jgi:hypothetical protein
MPTIQLRADVSPTELLRAVEQLPTQELEAFVQQMLRLRARRIAPHFAGEEGALLLRLNEGLPAEVWDRMRALEARREARELTPDEQQELVQLANRFEQFDADRLGVLSELARLRGVTLTQAMDDLGIRRRNDG